MLLINALEQKKWFNSQLRQTKEHGPFTNHVIGLGSLRHTPFPITPILSLATHSKSCHILFNIINPTGHVMHQQFNIQQLYVLPTLYLCVLYLSENKQRFVPLTP